jgi:sporulation protein YlmC with PRC-barrel domain
LEKKYLSRDKIVGKQVIDENGMNAGTVKDITFDLPGGKMFITMTDDKGKDTEISSDNVSAVGDVVLLTGSEKPVRSAIVSAKPLTPSTTGAPTTPVTSVTPPSSPKAPSSPGLCPNCNYQNEPDSHFCIKCGTKLK